MGNTGKSKSKVRDTYTLDPENYEWVAGKDGVFAFPLGKKYPNKSQVVNECIRACKVVAERRKLADG